MVPTPISALVIDLARNKSALLQAGAVTVPMDSGELKIVKLASDRRGYWRDEHKAITESDATFEPVLLKAVSLACLTRVSIEVIEDAQIFSETIENAIAEALALELDRVGLFGTGVGEPRGVYNTPGINELSYGTNGATPGNFDKFSEAAQAVADRNGTATTVILAPRTYGTLDRLKDSTNQPLQPPESYKALTKIQTNQVPTTQTQGSATNASCALVGNFGQVVVGMRTQLVLEASRVAGGAFEKMEVMIRGYLRADVAVLRPTHLTRIIGIKP